MSSVGTPLNCALLGHYAIHDADDGIPLYDEDCILKPYPRHQPRLQVVELLLQAGVSPHVRTSPILKILPLSIAVRTEDPNRCSALVDAGSLFSNYDLSVIGNRVDKGTAQAMGEYVIEQALKDVNTVLPEAQEALFRLAALYILTFGSSEAGNAERLLINISHYPDALLWASNIDLAWSTCTIRELYTLHLLLKKTRGITLNSPACFPPELRNWYSLLSRIGPLP